MEFLTFEPEPCRLATLLDTDEEVMDLWTCLDGLDGVKPGRIPTPSAPPMPMSAPLAIAGGRRSSAVTLQNDSAESAATMLGSSYEDREDLRVLGGGVPTWVPQMAPPMQWSATYPSLAAQYVPLPMGAQGPEVGPRPAAPASYSGLYGGAMAHAAVPAAGDASRCPCCSSQYPGAPGYAGHAGHYTSLPTPTPAPAPTRPWTPSVAPGNWAVQAGADGRGASPGPQPMHRPVSAADFFDAMDEVSAAPPLAAARLPRSQGSTMHGGRSRGSSFSACDQDQGSVAGVMETTASLDILAFEESDEDVLRLDATLCLTPPHELYGALAPPAAPAPRGSLFTQHHGPSVGRSVPVSPAGAPRGLTLRPTAMALKRSASAGRRLGGAAGDAADSDVERGYYGFASVGVPGPSDSARDRAAQGADGRPMRQAARRSMALAAATAAAEAWDDEASGGDWGGEDASSAGGGGASGGGGAGSGGGAPRGAAGGAASQGSPSGPKKKHNPWSAEETRALVAGVRGVGAGKWAEIKRTAPPGVVCLLATRSAVDLKDKWRNLTRVARLPKAQLKARLAKGSEVPLDVVLEVKELLDASSAPVAGAAA